METKNSTTNSNVQLAFEHVRLFFPNVTRVKYDEMGRWLFTDDKGVAPSFGRVDINVDMLEEAASSLEKLPVQFVFVSRN